MKIKDEYIKNLERRSVILAVWFFVSASCNIAVVCMLLYLWTVTTTTTTLRDVLPVTIVLLALLLIDLCITLIIRKPMEKKLLKDIDKYEQR